MDKHNQEHEHTARNLMRVLAGLLIGGLAGAGVMLLLAPQSGKRTRAQLQQKSIELREQASDNLDDAVAQVRVKARRLTSDISDKAEELQERSQELIDDQKERLSALRGNGKKALHSSHA
jgi:gas vesicle protein